MEDNLFNLVMEADEDLQAPEDIGDTAPAEEAPTEAPPADAPPADAGMNDPPPDLNAGNDDLSFNSGMDDMSLGMDGTNGNGDPNQQQQQEEEKPLSEKASNILNQSLYKKFTDRNTEIEQILANLQTIVPVLPYDVVKSNEKSITRLKTALSKGQDYCINNFVNMKYGENLTYFNKLDVLYKILLDAIDTNLKKFKNQI